MFMKKMFFAAVACLALFSCNDKQMDAPKPDAIEVTPRTATFGAKGGVADVIVTANAEWTLTADVSADWVTPSITEGADGEVVTFTVDSNTETDRQAVFTFKSGSAVSTFTVLSCAGEIPVNTFDLVSDAELSLGFEAEQVEISLTSSMTHYRDVKFTLSEGAQEWLEYLATIPGETERDAKIYFMADDLEGLDDREATITITAPGFDPVTVEVTQYAKHVLYAPAESYIFAVEGETVNIPVVANVEYEISMEGAEGWLTYGEATENGIPFTAEGLATGKRVATVRFTQTDAEEGEEPLGFEFTVTQVATIINWAADMTSNRLFPKWEGGGPGIVQQCTYECLVKFDNFGKPSGGIFTLMGVEGQFLVRMGDSGVDLTKLQVATKNGNYTVPFDFAPDTWYHIAVVLKNSYVDVYVNGEHKGQSNSLGTWSGHLKPNLSPSWSYEQSGNRCFWVGYSYAPDRDLYGQITEVRIWNKALTAEEINADNHFYEVDPASDGLFSYWKFTKGEGAVIEDATGRGNPLYGELDVARQSDDLITGTSGIDWVEIALPDR